NKNLGKEKLEEKALEKAYKKWWPDLEEQIHKAMERSQEAPHPEKKRSTQEILEEILNISRTVLNELSTKRFDYDILVDKIHNLTTTEEEKLELLDLVSGQSPQVSRLIKNRHGMRIFTFLAYMEDWTSQKRLKAGLDMPNILLDKGLALLEKLKMIKVKKRNNEKYFKVAT
ncbi:MAG: hypothetical protein GWN01_01095, partial [Nitrosopumilaceae archaeon]|nr:hypothetical protein [Nitrosopumilaceae archaeon]NIU85954.1 hypothetical protein [Nitrosopumilaceae archaeon]NIV64778.1 hypothetical protein [Nitrosopumilaceae archaeon]NIX60176.1 hypothetical protein [Nitrosopumilaceae archaeon]